MDRESSKTSNSGGKTGKTGKTKKKTKKRTNSKKHLNNRDSSNDHQKETNPKQKINGTPHEDILGSDQIEKIANSFVSSSPSNSPLSSPLSSPVPNSSNAIKHRQVTPISNYELEDLSSEPALRTPGATHDYGRHTIPGQTTPIPVHPMSPTGNDISRAKTPDYSNERIKSPDYRELKRSKLLTSPRPKVNYRIHGRNVGPNAKDLLSSQDNSTRKISVKDPNTEESVDNVLKKLPSNKYSSDPSKINISSQPTRKVKRKKTVHGNDSNIVPGEGIYSNREPTSIDGPIGPFGLTLFDETLPNTKKNTSKLPLITSVDSRIYDLPTVEDYLKSPPLMKREPSKKYKKNTDVEVSKSKNIKVQSPKSPKSPKSPRHYELPKIKTQSLPMVSMPEVKNLPIAFPVKNPHNKPLISNPSNKKLPNSSRQEPANSLMQDKVNKTSTDTIGETPKRLKSPRLTNEHSTLASPPVLRNVVETVISPKVNKPFSYKAGVSNQKIPVISSTTATDNNNTEPILGSPIIVRNFKSPTDSLIRQKSVKNTSGISSNRNRINQTPKRVYEEGQVYDSTDRNIQTKTQSVAEPSVQNFVSEDRNIRQTSQIEAVSTHEQIDNTPPTIEKSEPLIRRLEKLVSILPDGTQTEIYVDVETGERVNVSKGTIYKTKQPYNSYGSSFEENPGIDENHNYARQQYGTPEETPMGYEQEISYRPNYSTMSESEKARHYADFRIKFAILRRSFPEYEIPQIDPHENLDIIHSAYERYVRQIHVENEADGYKIYLIVLWLGIELVGVKWLKLNFSGYTISQLSAMNKYERLLIELGEKNYSVVGGEWPVEVRIIMLSLFNGLIFLLVKYLSGWLGEEVAGVVQTMITGWLGGDNNNRNNQNTRHRRQGPRTNIPVQEEHEEEENEGVPDPPERSEGGFNIGSMIAHFGSMFTNMNRGGDTGQGARRRPVFEE